MTTTDKATFAGKRVAPQQPTPETIAFFDAIRFMNTNKAAPDTSTIGAVGTTYAPDLNVLIETITLEPFETYQSELARLFQDNPHLATQWATYTPTEQGKRPKTLVNLLELRKRPRPQWVIEGFIYENTIIELHAEAGCYKSFLAFDWSARIATGTDWLDHHKVMTKGVVVYIAAEGADGYIARADAWCTHNNISFEALAENFFFWPESLPLTNSAEIARFIEEVTETLQESGQTPRLVVIDTLLRCSDGQNINAPDIMGTIFKGAESIKNELHAPNVLIVHHAGKNAQLGGMGSVVLKNNCDVIYSMEKDRTQAGQVILKAEKMKDKPELTTYLRSEKVYYTERQYEDESSLVLIAGERLAKKGAEQDKPELSKSQTDMLDILDRHHALRNSEWLKFYVEIGGVKSTFNTSLKKLQDAGIIENYEGKYRRYQEPLAEQENLDVCTEGNENE